MLGLPTSTQLHRSLAKARIYEKFGLSSSEKSKYDEYISHIYIENEISERSTRISAGESIKSFFVVSVQMKKADYDKKILERLSKLIPQKMLILVECYNLASIAVFEGGVLMQTEPAEISTIQLPLIASNLDQLWSNIVSYIGNFMVEEGADLKKTIEQNEEKRKIKEKIEALKKKAFKETQMRRKWELMAEAKKLELKLNAK